MKATIRLARYRDIHWAIEAIADSVDEGGPTFPPIIEPVIYHQLTNLISQGLVAIALVKQNDQPVVAGVMAIDVSEFPWNPNYKFFATRYFSVKRQFRASDAGIKLFNEMIAMAHLNGGDLMFSHLSSIDPETKDKLAERKGGQRRGSFHWFPVNKTDPEPMEN